MKVLVIGPSQTKSKGGMATVISEIMEDEKLKQKVDIDVYESFIDGNKLIRFFYSVYAYIKFCITKKNYDVYHIHMASRGSTFRKGYYVRKIKKWNKKVILHIHGAQYIEFFNEINDKQKAKVINILQSSNMVIALSEDWKNKFDTLFKLNNCVVLENGINMKKLEQAIINVDDYKNNFLTLGRLGQRKGTYDLIKAIKIAKNKVPNILCYLAGDGEIDKIKQLVLNEGLEKNIEVVGWADFEKKLSLLSKVSTVVLPSYNEGLPMAILEGMACGKGIISTKVGAIPEVIKEENGILIEPGDIDGLAQAIIRYNQDLIYLSQCSQKNISKIKDEFSMELMHEKLLTYYKEV